MRKSQVIKELLTGKHEWHDTIIDVLKYMLTTKTKFAQIRLQLNIKNEDKDAVLYLSLIHI